MSHNVCCSCCCLISRQGKCQSRIHNGKLRTKTLASGSFFQSCGLICNYCVRRSLTSCRCNGKNGSNRQSLCNLFFSTVEIQIISIIYRTCRNSFGWVNGTSSAYCQDKVYPFLFAQVDSLINQSASWIWLHSAQFHIRNGCLCKDLCDLIIQAASFDGTAAIMQQYFTSAKLFDQICYMSHRSFTEIKICWCIKCKIIHNCLPLFLQ